MKNSTIIGAAIIGVVSIGAAIYKLVLKKREYYSLPIEDYYDLEDDFDEEPEKFEQSRMNITPFRNF